jgi:transcriptional regulator with XRE-family HTH domain
MSPRRETAPFRRALGSAVLKRRRAQGHSQEDLGEVAGVDRTYVSGLESGKRNPTLETLLRLAAALEVPLSDLILEAERDGVIPARRRT